MASSSATTVPKYLAELPAERRSVMSRMRDLVRNNLPAGYEEGMDFGMIVWSIPLSRHSETYNGHPLGYVALAAQKQYYALYLSTYTSEEHMAAFTRAFAEAGKRMDMGKSCLRFKALEELPLDVVAREIARIPPDELIAIHERARARSKGSANAASRAKTKAPARTGAKKTAAKPTGAKKTAAKPSAATQTAARKTGRQKAPAKPAAPSTTAAGTSRPRRAARA